MQRWVKGTLIGVGIVALGAVSTLVGAALYGDSKMRRNIALPDYPIALVEDATSIEHGRYLFQTRGCTDCHAEDGGGRLFLNDPDSGLQVAGPNITPTPDSPVADYDAADWERTLRHGVKPSGQPLLIMPSEDYARMSDEDLVDLVAFLRHLPAVSRSESMMQLPLPVRALYGAGVIQDSAEKINHSLPPQEAVTVAANAEYGAYVGETCKGCHGALLSGGKIPGSPPDWPAAANLTPGEGSAMPLYPRSNSSKAIDRRPLAGSLM